MVFFLMGDVLLDLSDVRLTNRENPITGLPMEIVTMGNLFLKPFRRFGFRFLDHVLDGELARQPCQDMHMVLDTVNQDRGRIDIITENRRHVGKQFRTESNVSQETLAEFGGIHDVYDDIR
jgi:hypothetical protein